MKTIIRFEEERLDVNAIFRIQKKEYFDKEEDRLMFSFVINPNCPETWALRDLEFKYFDKDYRDRKLETLELQLENFEHIEFL